MTRAELTEKLLDIKREKGWSWKQICSEIGGMSPVLIAVLKGSAGIASANLSRFYLLRMDEKPFTLT
jgi:cyanate lyase